MVNLIIAEPNLSSSKIDQVTAITFDQMKTGQRETRNPENQTPQNLTSSLSTTN